MGLKDLCWCTNSHHPCGPSTTVSTQLICTNLANLYRYFILQLYHSTGKMVKKQGCNSPIYPRSTWQTAVHLHTMHTRSSLHTTATTTCTLCIFTTCVCTFLQHAYIYIYTFLQHTYVHFYNMRMYIFTTCVYTFLQHAYVHFLQHTYILQHVYIHFYNMRMNIFTTCVHLTTGVHSTACLPHVDVGEVTVHVDVSILVQLCGKLRGQGWVQVWRKIPQGIPQSQL